uniref:Reverse transcriptase domain-containing protein n=1 Tax=Neogobius melanostomus TaxID=47308 RepID=A0A8C6SMB2_9GOBI
MQITLELCGDLHQSKLRGYWKFNNTLLQDEEFNEKVKRLISEIFLDIENGSHKQKWEYFKYKLRAVAIQRSKNLKRLKKQKEMDLIKRINDLLSRTSISELEQVELKEIQTKLDQFYLDLAKGAYIRSRAKWIEEGETNSSYFFALEKRNGKQKSLTALKVNDTITTDAKVISNHVFSFYSKLYTSDFDSKACVEFISKIRQYCPVVGDSFKELCDSDLTLNEIKEAIFSMKKGKTPGIDGLPVEFFIHFWDTIKEPLFYMYKQCIDEGEMTPTMKQGVISLIPKADKDTLLIENWRPITLLTTDYKILSLVYANRLKKYLNKIIAETQCGFIKGRHISNNIRLVLDLLDYSDNVHSDAFILFVDFYKAFDTIEHKFIKECLQLFQFGNSFTHMVDMFYNGIDSSVIVNYNTTKRFNITRGVRQGCPISPFIFVLVVELLSINIVSNPELKGISIFNREIRISQLADDTALFLKDKNQLQNAISLIEEFTKASGLKLNVSKCELIPIHSCEDLFLETIPVKQSVKYLGIQITKNKATRQQLNVHHRIVKTQSIFNLWLQRDLTLYGRVLLSKAEGLSRFVYPLLSLYVDERISKEINTLFLNFIWKNKPHKLKKAVLSNAKAEGGLEILEFSDTVNTFRINWLKRCLANSKSIWYFIPNYIFDSLGGLSFLLTCNYAPTKLPVSLANFHQQCLLAWKLCFNHNFSPHKYSLWNNEHITIRNRSLFFPKWFQKNINKIVSLLDEHGSFLPYEQFMVKYEFPIPFREYNSVIKAIPPELLHLIRCHLSFYNINNIDDSSTVLTLNGINLLDRKCNNHHIRKMFQNSNKITPRGKFFWNSLIEEIDWKRTWLLPYKYCITNKMKEVHFKIIHKIYPVNLVVSRYADVDKCCTFCQTQEETLEHLFFFCNIVQAFWAELSSYIFKNCQKSHCFTLKDIICYFEDNTTTKSFHYVVNFFILFGKFLFTSKNF